MLKGQKETPGINKPMKEGVFSTTVGFLRIVCLF